MGGAIVTLFLYPLLNTSILRSGNFRPIYAVVFLLFVADFCLLRWAGTTPVDDYFRFIGVFVSVGYFAFFILGGLFVGWLEKNLMLHAIKMRSSTTNSFKDSKDFRNHPSYKLGVFDYSTPKTFP